MNSIFRFLKSKSPILLFIALEIFCVIAIVRSNAYHSAFYFNNTRKIAAKTHELNQSFYKYFDLYKKNQDLFNENIQLRKQLKENFIFESKKLFTFRDSIVKLRYDYLQAQVIYNSINQQKNYMTLNKGKSSGIQRDMWVFSPEGVVGKVEEVSENYCLVASLLNSEILLVPKIKEANFIKGTVSWDGLNPEYAKLDKINKYEALKVGYHLLSNPYSKNLPENIPIGTIAEIKSNSSDPYYQIKIKYAVDFSRVNMCYIAINLFKSELDSLENKIIEKQK